MIIVIIFLSVGIMIGYFLRQKRDIIKISTKLLMLSIYLLLFLLGVAVGTNETIISNFANIGFKAILIAISGVVVSVVISSFVYRIFFQDQNEK